MLIGEKRTVELPNSKNTKNTNQMKTTWGTEKAYTALSGSSFINRC